MTEHPEVEGRASTDEGQGLLALLRFWESLPKPKTMSEEDKNRHRAAIRSAKPDARKAALDGLARQYDEVRSDFDSTRSRAGGLLTATGVITGLVTLSTPFVAALQSRSPVGIGGLIVTLALLYCAVATAWLAVRAQQVTFWGQAVIDPEHFATLDEYEIEFSWSLYVIFKENQERLKAPVAYLRDAETFFRGAIVGLGLIVILTLVSSAVAPSSSSPQHITTNAASTVRPT